jgi:hypothetical protein
MAPRLEAVHWNIVSITEYLGGGCDGRQVPWIAVAAQRPYSDALRVVTGVFFGPPVPRGPLPEAVDKL